MAIRAVVWGENIHDRENAVVRGIYPKGMHGAIAEALNEDGAIKASTATMEEPEHGLPEARLAAFEKSGLAAPCEGGEIPLCTSSDSGCRACRSRTTSGCSRRR